MTPAQERLLHAELSGAAQRLQDITRHQPELVAVEREHWPELWTQIDRLFTVLHSRPSTTAT